VQAPPLWLRWVLTLLLFGALAIAVVVMLQGSNDSQQKDAAALLRANEAGRAVVKKDQAPHSSLLPRGVSPRVALERAIAADARSRAGGKQLPGPVRGVRCAPTRAGPTARRQLRCAARAGGIDFPYFGVVDLRARRLTWCKFDPAPASQVAVPVSPRCEA